MLLLDTNVCIYAWRRESPHHHEVKDWLEAALIGPQPVGLPGSVLASLVRITTNHRIYREPSTPGAALDFCDALISAPAGLLVEPGIRHWAIFRDLVASHRLRANDIPDAYLAALALENDATWVTFDRGFARFHLRTLDPTLAG